MKAFIADNAASKFETFCNDSGDAVDEPVDVVQRGDVLRTLDSRAVAYY